MFDRGKIQIDLIKLAEGGRLLRVTEPQSGLSLERKIDHKRPIHDQKRQLIEIFEATLARAQASLA
jgi:hypothetical protein